MAVIFINPLQLKFKVSPSIPPWFYDSKSTVKACRGKTRKKGTFEQKAIDLTTIAVQSQLIYTINDSHIEQLAHFLQ